MKVVRPAASWIRQPALGRPISYLKTGWDDLSGEVGQGAMGKVLS